MRAVDEPAIACPTKLNPLLVPIAGQVQSSTSGDLTVFRLPQARGAQITIDPAPGGLQVTWTDGPPAAAPRPAEEPAAAEPHRQSQPEIQLPVEAAQAPATVSTSSGSDQSADTEKAVVDLLQRYDGDLSKYQYDFSIPESPGFVVLGLSPETVVHPRSLRELVFSLKNGVDDTGHYKTGLALDFAPLQLFQDEVSLISELQKKPQSHGFNTFNQAMLNTTVSIATTKGTTSDDESVKLGVGLHIPLIDKSDGRTDEWLKNCYDARLGDAIAALRTSQSTPDHIDEHALQPASKGVEQCYRDAPSRRWNASVWTVSLGYAMASESGRFGDSRPGSRGIWTSYAYGFDGGPKILSDNAQLILHAKSLYKERVPDPDDAAQIVERDNASIGLGFRVGKENLNVSLQGSYAWIDDRTHDRKDEEQRLALGVEYRVAKDIWLVASVGGTNGDSTGGKDSFVLGELKFGSATGPQFNPRK